MNVKDASEAGRLVTRLAGAVISTPVVTGFLALGAVVLVGRMLLDVARRTRRRVLPVAGRQRDAERENSKAA